MTMSEEEHERGPVRRVWCAWLERPTVTTLPLILVFAGIGAVWLGNHASKAFDNFGGSVLVRVLGSLLVLGGVTVLAGILRRDRALEPIGLTFTVCGLAIYGAGAVCGLGTQGLISGLVALGAAAGFLGQIRLLIRESPPRE